MKKDGLEGNVSYVTADAWALCQNLFIFPSAAVAAPADYYFHPPTADCPIPSGRTHGCGSEGKLI